MLYNYLKKSSQLYFKLKKNNVAMNLKHIKGIYIYIIYMGLLTNKNRTVSYGVRKKNLHK